MSLKPHLEAYATTNARQLGRALALANLGKAQIYLARPRIGPPAGDNFAAGVELHPLRAIHMDIAEQRRFPTAEAVVRDRNRNRHIDSYHPDLHVELELPSRPPVLG